MILFRAPRSHITIGKEYVVVENLSDSDKFSIINDKMKLARYSKFRFIIVDYSPVLPIRENFNMLTLPMRLRIVELEKQLKISLQE